MNGNKEIMEIEALDSAKIHAGLEHTQFTEAQIIASILSTRKGIMPKVTNCRTVTLMESPQTIDSIRQSLADMGLREVVKEVEDEAA